MSTTLGIRRFRGCNGANAPNAAAGVMRRLDGDMHV